VRAIENVTLNTSRTNEIGFESAIESRTVLVPPFVSTVESVNSFVLSVYEREPENDRGNYHEIGHNCPEEIDSN
jgi:hypothetical protein